MISWIKDNLGLKGSLILAAFIVLIAGALIGSKVYRNFKNSQYTGIATAQVTDVEEKTMMYQDMGGSRIKVSGYLITYTFAINSIYYAKTENLKPAYEIKLLYNSFNTGKTCYVEVKYLPDNPNKSAIERVLELP